MSLAKPIQRLLGTEQLDEQDEQPEHTAPKRRSRKRLLLIGLVVIAAVMLYRRRTRN